MNTRLALHLVAMASLCTGCATRTAHETWRLDRTDTIGGFAPEVLGAPMTKTIDGHQAVCFDGRSDGLIVPVNPIEGWPSFTVEILFRPDGDGPEEQRFLHIQDDAQRRLLIETRVDPARTWALDTFLHSTSTDRLTLLDRTITQPTDRWYRAALVYDGTTMSHYVDGVKQLEGAVRFPPMSKGSISLGVRQNRIHWFKGCIAEVRFTAGVQVPTFR